LGELATRINAHANDMDFDQIAGEIDAMISRQGTAPKVFVSHSHADRGIAEALVNALEQAFVAKAGEIRATSLPGYGLAIGASIPEELREEIDAAEIVLGIITPSSLQSEFVLFELGASWGLEETIYPLLALEAKQEDLPGPLKERRCIKLADSNSCYEMIEHLRGQGMLPLKHDGGARLNKAVQRLTRAAQERAQPQS
jgi:hypothetical protein